MLNYVAQAMRLPAFASASRLSACEAAMNEQINDYLAGLASAQIALFGILIEHLERRAAPGLKSEFADELRLILDMSAREKQPLPDCQRVIFEQLAGWLGKSGSGWTPVVIEGSRSGPVDSPSRHAGLSR